MCGLTGIFATGGRAEMSRDLLESMNDSLAHRGPDEVGTHLGPGIALGHRRLSIIDLADGQQPMFNEDGSVVVVFNGEIYNFRELRRDLEALGHSFRTHSDTEVIVHAWETWGRDCVQRFRGMFAFALYDGRQDALFLARDRLGIKPLYYSLLPDGQLIFGSELKALRVHHGFRTALDERAVEAYFALGYVPDPLSIFCATHKLPPGHTLVIARGAGKLPQPQCYWDIRFDTRANPNPERAGAELLERLREAVDVRLIAEVPLGAFLSGGVDSSAVVAMMAGLSEDPVTSCSIAFGEAEYNEAAYAAQVAQRYATKHHVDTLDPTDLGVIDRLTWLYDEPFADSSAMPTFRVCELARRHVTVALSGDGGDEGFAGYRRYGWHLEDLARKSHMPRALRGGLGLLGNIWPDSTRVPAPLRRRQGLLSFAQDPVTSFCEINAVMKRDLRRRIYTPGFRKSLQGFSSECLFADQARNAGVDDTLALAQYLDFKLYLPGDILTKVDRASMANGLEVRVPMLDHQFIEWVARLPNDFKRRNGEGKYLLKKALEPHLPEDILYRPKKGFAVPLAKWFRGPLSARIGAVAQSERLADSGIFDMREIRRLHHEHAAGTRDWDAQLWSLLMFDAFLESVA